MKKKQLVVNLPSLQSPVAAPSIDAHIFDAPPPAAPPAAPVAAPVAAKPVRLGRPPKSTAVAVPGAALPGPEEDGSVPKLVFTSQLLPDVYILLYQYEHHSGAEIREILNDALRAYLIPKPEAHQSLPPVRAAKLQEKLLKK